MSQLFFVRVAFARVLVFAVLVFAVVAFAVLAFAVLAFLVLAFLVLGFDARELVLDAEFEREAAGALCVIAARNLSKSLSACLLVFDASRRSAVSAVVTSL